eukprot:IDg9387t1
MENVNRFLKELKMSATRRLSPVTLIPEAEVLIAGGALFERYKDHIYAKMFFLNQVFYSTAQLEKLY